MNSNNLKLSILIHLQQAVGVSDHFIVNHRLYEMRKTKKGFEYKARGPLKLIAGTPQPLVNRTLEWSVR